MNFVGISRNDKELKDLDESDTKSTVFSGNLRNVREISQNFDYFIFHNFLVLIIFYNFSIIIPRHMRPKFR